MPRPSAELELQTNFNAISKNVKILQIGPVEPKLWKIREINVVWLVDHAGWTLISWIFQFYKESLPVY